MRQNAPFSKSFQWILLKIGFNSFRVMAVFSRNSDLGLLSGFSEVGLLEDKEW